MAAAAAAASCVCDTAGGALQALGGDGVSGLLFEERLARAEQRRVAGNELYAAGKFKEALGKYAVVRGGREMRDEGWAGAKGQEGGHTADWVGGRGKRERGAVWRVRLQGVNTRCSSCWRKAALMNTHAHHPLGPESESANESVSAIKR